MATRDRSMFVAVAAAVLLAGLLAGCAKAGDSTGASVGGGSSGGSGPAVPSAIAGSPAGPVPSGPAPSRSAGTTSAPTGADVTVTGNLEDGVEPNCTLLRTASTLYLLVGNTSGLRSHLGSPATITGHAMGRPMATTCQQGTPFLVTSSHIDRAGS